MKTAIIGGGASGLMCAVAIKKDCCTAAVTVYERNPRVGKKILATGNGRCNLTNLNLTGSEYRNFDFARYALTEFSPEDNISFFNSLGLFTKTDSSGRVYPLSNRAESVLDALRNAADIFGVRFETDTLIERIERKGNGFIVGGKYYNNVVIACGGKAAPSQGTDGKGYMLLKAMGHRIVSLYPSLVQLVTGESKYPKQLKGVRCDVRMTFGAGKEKITKQGELLFADYGLSGIVSMEMSAHISPYLLSHKSAQLTADFIPSMKSDEIKNAIAEAVNEIGSLTALDIMSGFVPTSLGRCILKESFVSSETKINQLSKSQISSIIKTAKYFSFIVTGTKDFSNAQVTGGGAAVNEFDSTTMESKKVQGLYATGEVLDVDGDCGGYNLNWAWSSARLCARSITEQE